jgi:hypothetical protein
MVWFLSRMSRCGAWCVWWWVGCTERLSLLVQEKGRARDVLRAGLAVQYNFMLISFLCESLGV